MELVEQADRILQYARDLYQQHHPIMRGDDRMIVEDRMLR